MKRILVGIKRVVDYNVRIRVKPDGTGVVTVEADADCHRARLELAELIERRFDIHHTTLQVEHEPERLVQIES